ncbi:FAD-binding oxidoreductase [Microbacterium sp.]|uniref:NAD(P)/FAD-dependent oxidoreductase n=1 Tax=Microbacterium sp. TaxID=51671 RepID=UPI002736EC0E|nr:FAD-dependent oxidoreductase [Microbacterium sp.]
MSAAWRVPNAHDLDIGDAGVRSFWLADALADEPDGINSEPLVSKVRADVCIVGGGFTGLWTAIELKTRDPSIEVILLEAGLCGCGASGTNAGMLMNLWPKLPSLLRAGGGDEGADVARASVEAIDHILRFCVEHGIDAQVESNGWLWASNNSSQDEAWGDTLEAATAYRGCPFVEVDAAEATRLAGAPARGGLLDPTCVGLHPARLARGLLGVARSMGVVVHEHTPMTGLLREHAGTTVTTGYGSVRAASVVLAINAWCNQFPQLRSHLVMTASDNVVVRPRREPENPPLTNVSDSGRLLDYWRPMSGGDILFGKAGLGIGWGVRGTNTLFGAAPRQGRLLAQMARTVPGLAGAELVSSWRAPVEYSLSSLPFFGEITGFPGVYYGTGYSGDGIGPSVIGAQVLAGLATRSTDGMTTSFLTRPPSGRGLPPEPFRYLGGQLVKTAMLRQDRKQDDGTRIDLPTRLVARIDPTTFLG